MTNGGDARDIIHAVVEDFLVTIDSAGSLDPARLKKLRELVSRDKLSDQSAIEDILREEIPDDSAEEPPYPGA